MNNADGLKGLQGVRSGDQMVPRPEYRSSASAFISLCCYYLQPGAPSRMMPKEAGVPRGAQQCGERKSQPKHPVCARVVRL
jgi:hypothetical protein